MPLRATFLSCLFGSEPINLLNRSAAPFLSCLFGSERERLEDIERLLFLSCLFGSERSGRPAALPFPFSKLPIRQ